MSAARFNPLPLKFSNPVYVSDEEVTEAGVDVEDLLDAAAKKKCHPDYAKKADRVIDEHNNVMDWTVRHIYFKLYQGPDGFMFAPPVKPDA